MIAVSLFLFSRNATNTYHRIARRTLRCQQTGSSATAAGAQPVVVVEPPKDSKAVDVAEGEERAETGGVRVRGAPLAESPVEVEDKSPVLAKSQPLEVPTDDPAASSPGSVRTNRSRSSSIFVMDDVDEADSEADSVLSFWSDDESDASDADVGPTDTDADAERRKEEERARREAEREKQLAKAGLKIRREPPGVPVRRKAPAVPSRAHKPSAQHNSNGIEHMPEEAHSADEPIQVEDAYARYEAFLAEAKSKPAPRPQPKVHTEVALPVQAAPAPTASSRLSGLFSRITGAGHQHQPAKPVVSRPVSGAPISGPISGPITPKPPAEHSEQQPEEEFGQGFGQTWSSLVDASVLETMPPQERKRQEAMFELIATEASYVADVQLIVGVWYARLVDTLDEQSLGVIFANIEDIMMFNSRLLSLLEERQKECRLYIDSIADILNDNLKDLDVYIPYCLNQENARRLLVQLRRQRPELDQKLVAIRNDEPTVRGLDISSFLLEPSKWNLIPFVSPSHHLWSENSA